jgi:hypothetical protein
MPERRAGETGSLPHAGGEAANVARLQAGAEKASVAPQAAVSKAPMKGKTPRVDWAELLRRMFDFDVFV